MPESYRISHFCCCSMICCYIFPNGSGMETHYLEDYCLYPWWFHQKAFDKMPDVSKFLFTDEPNN
jgi:hypothetical protein